LTTLTQTIKNRELQIRVKPNSSKDGIKICDDGSLEIKITANPVENAANIYLIKYLSKLTKIAQSKFCISSGKHSRNKKISCQGYSADEILEILGKNY
jgi:uncharacterized protein (TIGR00251 family)